MTDTRPPANGSENSWRRRGRLILKELRETLRDRRTILTLVLMPVLAYPLLGMAFQRLLISQFDSASRPEYQIAFRTADEWAAFDTLFQSAQEIYDSRERYRMRTSHSSDERSSDDIPSRPGRPARGPDGRPQPLVAAQVPGPQGPAFDVEHMVAGGLVDVGVVYEQRPRFTREEQVSGLVRLVYQPQSPRSAAAYRYLSDRLDALNASYLFDLAREFHRARGVTDILAIPLPSAEGQNTVLASLVPLILLLMTVTGAVYPAIDLTAGERERYTLETLMAAPVPRLELLFAKYIAVLAVATLTAVINLASMYVTMQAAGFEQVVFGESGLRVGAVLALLGLLIVFATFFSAVLLCITSMARSFKEAQAYLIPLMLLSIAPGVVSLVPGMELDGRFAAVPLLNMVLLARGTVLGTATGALAAVVVGSTLVYGAGALGLAAHWFGGDAVLSGSSGRWIDLVARPQNRSQTLAADIAAGVLALMFPAYLLVGSLIGRQADLSITTRLALNAVLTAGLSGLWPWAVILWRKASPVASFQLRRPTALAMCGGLLAGSTAWPLVYEVTLLQQSLGIRSLDQAQVERAQGVLQEIQGVPFPVILICLAAVPAVFEELSFRGLLLASLRRRWRGWTTVIVTAAAFGCFHLFIGGTLAIERLLPSTLLGLALGALAWWSGSVFPGMLFHMLNNGLLMGIARYQEPLKKFGLDMENQVHMPALWQVAAAAGVLLGLGMAWMGRRQEPRTMTGEVA